MMPRLVSLLILITLAPAAYAQVPDTTAATPAPPDTLVAPDSLVTADTLVAAAPQAPAPPDSVIAFYRDQRGEVLRRGDPARSTALHLSELLMDAPIGFHHTFRTAGWPDGWSPYGFAPGSVTVRRDGIAHVNLMTGRSAMEMIAAGMMDPPRVAAGVNGGAMGIVLNTRTFDQARPLTGLRYQTDNIGLQHVEAFHAQRRLATILGRSGELNLLGIYMGRGATGEYPGSSLQRERGLFGRIRFARPTWSVQLTNLYGRHRIGAHGGVVPWSGGVYETIYSRTDAVVRNNGARRFTIRNDLDLRLRALLRGHLVDVSANRTSESFRYVYQNEPTEVRIHRYGTTAANAFSLGGHRLRFDIDGWIEHVESDSALHAGTAHQRYAFEARVRDSLDVGGFAVAAEAGLRHTDAGTKPVGLLRIARGGPVTSFVEGALSAIDVPRIATQGFGELSMPVDGLVPSQALKGRAGIAVRPGSFLFELSGFIVRERDRLMMSIDDEDVLRFAQAAVPADRAGITLRSGFRADQPRGVYVDAHANLIHWMTEPIVTGAAPLSEAQPMAWGSARLGARMLLFQGDLDADLYVRGFLWSGMRGRVLHAPTGLLALPAANARWFNPNGALDVILEAQVRTATIFLGYENVLSGTDITLGDLVVPDYPLPERRFRIGVYWPIED